MAALTFSIPYYAGKEYLARAIASILAQDDDRWIGRVIDDGSEPDVEAFVREVGRGKIDYVKNPQNLGLAGNFNRCIDLATTELVTVLHADDELMPNYARSMIAVANRHPDAAAYFCRVEIIGPDSNPRFSLADLVKHRLNPARDRELVVEGEPGVRALLKANFIAAPTLCFRKSVLGDRRFPHGFKFVMDWELTTKLLLDGDKLVGIPERCYRYRRHEEAQTSVLSKNQLRFREESDYYDRMKVKCTERSWDECVRLATQKRIIKLNITYRALKSAALLDLGSAKRGLQLLKEL